MLPATRPILLLGKTGQVGLELQRSLLPLGPVIALGRAQADLARPERLASLVARHRPGLIVNAAAWTAVDAAESEPDAAQRVNADAVAELAQAAVQHDALLLHYSTDYVFDGSKRTPWTEDDTPAPLNVYGHSKHAGEQAIAASGCQALVLRTSWVYSARGRNFVRTITRLAQERDSLSVVDDQHGAPTSALLIADVSALAVAAWRQGTLPAGLYHLSAAGRTSWHGLALQVLQHLQERGLRLRLRPDRLRAIPSRDYPTPARRPANSCLDTTRLSQALHLCLPDWRSDLARVIGLETDA
ncbi:MAG: dTDP-4-dehydrorhamnose reductase [Castellaniella sp.]